MNRSAQCHLTGAVTGLSDRPMIELVGSQLALDSKTQVAILASRHILIWSGLVVHTDPHLLHWATKPSLYHSLSSSFTWRQPWGMFHLHSLNGFSGNTNITLQLCLCALLFLIRVPPECQEKTRKHTMMQWYVTTKALLMQLIFKMTQWLMY